MFSRRQTLPTNLRWAIFWMCLMAVSTCVACPFCLAPSQTWAEMLEEADVVLWCKLISVEKGNDRQAPASKLTVVKVARGRKHAKAGQVVKLEEQIYAAPGDTILLKGSFVDQQLAAGSSTFATDSEGRKIETADVKRTELPQNINIQPASAMSDQVESPDPSFKNNTLVWDFAEPVSKQAFEYITTAPKMSVAGPERLLFFLKNLEHSDELIASDAWGEFANARYEDIVKIKKHFPADSLKYWITHSEYSPERPALYGMMLGLCGRKEDAAFLKNQIGSGARTDVRFGVDGLMGGLLLLTKEEGLQFLIDSRLNNPNATTSEVFSAMAAVKYMWQYEPDMINKDKLKASLRPLLKRSEFQELAIIDLSQWEDWDSLPEVAEVVKTTNQEGVINSAITFCWHAEETTHATLEQRRNAAQLLTLIRETHPSIYRRKLRHR